MFRTIWVHSGSFGCLTKLGAKRAELVQKFVRRSRFGIFGNEPNRSTALDPKLTIWCVLLYLGALGIWTQTDVLVRFVLFGCIRNPLVAS